MEYAWIIPIFPLLSFIVLLLFSKSWKEKSAYISSSLIGISFILSIVVLLDRLKNETFKSEFTWLEIGQWQLTVGFEINQLNAIMLAIVTFISLLVHIYSKGYMHGDKRLPVYYAYLGLFTFAMLGLVISPNLLQTYIFWELVGVGSFLLIGFYFYKETARDAAKKAFIITRIGDIGFFIGMILLFWNVGSFEYDEIFAAVANGEVALGVVTLCSILIFIGAMGKSGQFPLHSWLPDAMEGPTPVSALIHAATMVAAGVYLVASLFPMYLESTTALTVVAVVGGITAIFAASIALVQKDIKKILAYSTVSQLGYMMLALGLGGYFAAVFHLSTHAMFKALLFLAAGAVIHAVGTQNIKEMGGLWHTNKVTAISFLVGAFCISGFPLFSGFFSKEEILAVAYESGNMFLFWLAMIAAFFTAFYMFRLFFLVFFGTAKTKVHHAKMPKSMDYPLVILAIASIAIGGLKLGDVFENWLAEGNPAATVLGDYHAPLWVMITAIAISLAGILLAYLVYYKETVSRDAFRSKAPGLFKTLENKYYVDEIYNGTFVAGTTALSRFFDWFERSIIGGIITLVGGMVSGLSTLGSKAQSGQTQTYVMVTFIGLAIMLVVFFVTGGMEG